MTMTDGAPPSVPVWSLTKKQSLVVKWATVTTVLLAAVAVLTAAFVLWGFSLPARIEHDSLNRLGEARSPENALVYLFLLPVFQCWIAFIGVLQSCGARTGVPNAQVAEFRTKLQSLFPQIRPAKQTARGHEIFSVGVAFVQFGLLPCSIYRAVLVAMHSS